MLCREWACVAGMFLAPYPNHSNKIDITRVSCCDVPLFLFCPFFLALLSKQQMRV
jgi:hypothetical protein